MADTTFVASPKDAPDVVLTGAVVTLVAVGLVMIFSASSAIAVALHHDAGYFLKRQLTWLALAIVAAFFAYRIDYHKLRRFAPYALGATIVALVLVLVPHVGTLAGGASRWLGIGPVQFEPSEFAKLSLVLYLASALSAKGERIKSLVGGLFPLAFVTGLLAVLVIKQPDFGTATLLAFTAGTMLFVAGARIEHMLMILAAIAPPALLLVRHDPYKWARITAFIDPWEGRARQRLPHRAVAHGARQRRLVRRRSWLLTAEVFLVAGIVDRFHCVDHR